MNVLCGNGTLAESREARPTGKRGVLANEALRQKRSPGKRSLPTGAACRQRAPPTSAA
ncbi:hypothetical protein HMPREF0972_01457 [Actinomyces sp. oral taxon 848 str. F0332]|nr:hypothetical protein HMPREF0972_01457 [Actinomyces sp. oral taxon 848 str. F0332]